jgi:hypothetical protein
MTPDPAGAGAASGQDPVSWNRYAYTGGDPVNRSDPSGLLFYPGYEGCVANGFYGGGDVCPINDDGDVFGFQGPGGNCDPSLASCSNACLNADGSLNPSPFCQYGGALPIPLHPKPIITCDLQLFIQPVGNNLDPVYHTYVGLVEQINGVQLPEIYFEAGSVSKSTGQITASFFNAWLNSLDTANPTSHAYNNTSSTLVWQTGFSSSECPVNAAVVANASRYPQKTITYGFPSPNSNSFTYSLLTMSGVAIPWRVNLGLGTPLLGPILGLPSAPGWGTVIRW